VAFAFQAKDLAPDVVTLAKGLGGGVPVGAVAARGAAANALVPGDHGTTFGGNPLACAAVAAVLTTLHKEGLAENASEMGTRLSKGLESIPGVESVRGKGLLVAAEIEPPASEVAALCLKNGLLVNAVRPHSLRFAPPLNTTAAEIDRALAILARVMSTVVEAPESAD
jgi:acetylornithine/N-succinyldiaminopimelate aminotransferase